MDERAEQLQKEFAVSESQRVPKEIGGIPPVVAAATKQEGQTAPLEEMSREEIMVPKWRFDEINQKYQSLRTQPQPEAQPEPVAKSAFEIEKLVESKIAPLRVQLEVDRVLKSHSDFSELAPKVMERIKIKPALSLEEAYQLEKFSQIESTAKEEGKQEAYQVIEKKASLQVERQGRKAVQRSVEDMIQDKSVPLSEIASILRQQ